LVLDLVEPDVDARGPVAVPICTRG
jgi:hypothetical protein